jgi:hypothetical protein
MEEGLAKIPNLQLAQFKFQLVRNAQTTSNQLSQIKEKLLREIVENSNHKKRRSNRFLIFSLKEN